MNYPKQSMPDSKLEIELSQDEIDAALAEAKEKKAKVIEHKRREDMRNEWENYHRAEWSSSQFHEFVKARMVQAGFQLNENNRELVWALVNYFTSKPAKFNDSIKPEHTEFEEHTLNKISVPMDHKKGIFLFGTVGVGKTRLMELFALNKRQCFQMISCRKVASEYVKHGFPVIEPLSNQSYPFVKTIGNFWHESMGVCFDDLGTESDANNYGNKRNVFEQIILDRYDNHLPFDQTHITSNLTPEMVKERYGERVSSRMREMFNLIELTGKDLRR